MGGVIVGGQGAWGGAGVRTLSAAASPAANGTARKAMGGRFCPAPPLDPLGVSAGVPRARRQEEGAGHKAPEKWQPTLLIDEADTFLNKNDELRGVLNSGHSRDTAFVIRTVGDSHEPERFSTWGPKAIAGIGTIKDTLRDRSIEISMQRKLPSEKVERLRVDRLAQFGDLRRKCLRWAIDNLDALKACDPVMPDALHDRAADNWRPLSAIAHTAGGAWPTQIHEAMTALEGAQDDAAVSVMLLEDMHALFEKRKVDRIPT